MQQSLVYFNGIDLDKAASADEPYFRPPEQKSAFIQVARPAHDGLTRKNMADGVNPLCLASAGWGVIVHETDQHLLEPLEPLLRHRREQAGSMYFNPMTFGDGDSLDSFLERHDAPLSEADGVTLPYYLLIVGPPEGIPFQFQTVLDIAYAVGRVSFDDPADYANYAHNVVAYETREAAIATPRLTLFNAENNEPLSQQCAESLIAPLEQHLDRFRRRRQESWTLRHVNGSKARRKHLAQLMGGPETPSVLFTVSHGACASKSPERRVRLQGGLVCADWQKPAGITRDDCLCAEDLEAGADLTGLISFHYACYSAGTPRFDHCSMPGDALRELHHKPFVAKLPQAMLSAKKGALAVIGHVDQAFQHSYLWRNKTPQITHFSGTLTKIMRGCPVGYAMEHINRRFAAVSAALLGSMWTPTEEDELTRRLAWQDASHYVLLGDPAVRLNRENQA